MDYQEVTLTNLNGGVVLDLFNEELGKVLENIADPNTPAEQTREIKIVVKFKPNEERGTAATTIQASSELASPRGHGSFVTFGTDGIRARAYVTDTRQAELGLAREEPAKGDAK